MKKILPVFLVFSFLFFSKALCQVESDIVITEILYNQNGPDTLEFIELYNRGTTGSSINLEGYTLSSGLKHVFTSYSLDSGKYVVVSRYKEFVDDFFTINSLQWDSGGLDNTGEKIVLKDPAGNIADSVEYNDKFPWPESADGGGSSLALCNPNSDNSTYMTWSTGAQFYVYTVDGVNYPIYASPGKKNTNCYPPGDIVKPEIISSKTTSQTEVRLTFSEPITNPSNLANYSGLGISAITSPTVNEIVLTLSSPIVPETRYNLYVQNIQDTATNILDTTLVYVGYNTTNPDLIITEILYDHPGGDSLEFLEIKYVGSSPAPLGGIYFSSGLTYMFPTLTAQPGQLIIIADSPNDIAGYFGAVGAYEWLSGSLDNKGEKLLISNSVNDTVFYMQYDTISPWPARTIVDASIIACTEIEAELNEGTSWTYSPSSLKAVDASPGTTNTCPTLSTTKTIDSWVKIFPMPADSYFHINLTEVGDYMVRLSDLTGQVIKSSTIQNTNKYIFETGSDLQPGVYIITVESKNTSKSITKKVIIH